MTIPERLILETREMNASLAKIRFEKPVTHVYNPLAYGWSAHARYLQNYASARKRVMFLGMNPGPFGMAQTAVPFGEVAAVRDWMGIEEPIGQPDHAHPKRPVTGFACPRSEVSGRRLWSLFAERFQSPTRFFKEHFVVNYCPLVFMEESGRNRTPDKLSRQEREAVYAICDGFLRSATDILRPQWVVAIGDFALKRAQKALNESGAMRLEKILHPSPASPAANRGWAEQATRQLQEAGIWT